MLEEEQISFRSASLMFDGVEDYSHQIAEMIGLRNDNFIQAGVSGSYLMESDHFNMSPLIAGCSFLPHCPVYF